MENIEAVFQTTKESLSGDRTVLVADDDPIFRRLLQKRLQDWGYKVIAVDNGEKAWEALQQPGTSPSLIILDWLMPGIDGIEICRRIRSKQQPSYQYILLISGKDDKQDVVEGLDAGADDYLTKPFDSGELRARLRAGSRVLSLQHDLLQAHEELRYQATHDALTGVWSRGAVLDLLRCELHRGMRTDAFTGVLMIDVDHFKAINDAYGHLVGDAVLKEIACRAEKAVRSYDFVGRYGGEEFIAVLSNCSAADLRTVAERACRAVSEMPVILQSDSILVTVSIGGFVAKNGSLDTELLAAADAALYEAKRNGRNQVVISTDGVMPVPEPTVNSETSAG
jgi:two-component system, cell cycle response regulator